MLKCSANFQLLNKSPLASLSYYFTNKDYTGIYAFIKKLTNIEASKLHKMVPASDPMVYFHLDYFYEFLDSLKNQTSCLDK